jgi:hypothetical protein
VFFRLTGVVQNGAPQSPSVPSNAAVRLGPIPIAASVSIEIDVVNPDGTPVNLAASGISLEFSVKKSPMQSYAIFPGFEKTVTSAANPVARPRPNAVLVKIVPTDTQNLQPGNWVYDVWLLNTSTSPTTREPIVPLSPFVLVPAVTLP